MRTLTRSLIDELIEKGGCDFQADVSRRMPIYISPGMMELPLAHAAAFVTGG